ncbi:hypothetical protein I79_019217 [Cricetulus griseus]|uniref:Uncharacterized protein n=1 Tax=Cricetulus griseus TaxID=10029 RepID=G3I6T9_CRIGR|nr:hypothetical protein I79_019217 [Cricetulus griseus]
MHCPASASNTAEPPVTEKTSLQVIHLRGFVMVRKHTNSSLGGTVHQIVLSTVSEEQGLWLRESRRDGNCQAPRSFLKTLLIQSLKWEVVGTFLALV